jgi:hypothetical protein
MYISAQDAGAFGVTSGSYQQTQILESEMSSPNILSMSRVVYFL